MTSLEFSSGACLCLYTIGDYGRTVPWFLSRGPIRFRFHFKICYLINELLGGPTAVFCARVTEAWLHAMWRDRGPVLLND